MKKYLGITAALAVAAAMLVLPQAANAAPRLKAFNFQSGSGSAASAQVDEFPLCNAGFEDPALDPCWITGGVPEPPDVALSSTANSGSQSVALCQSTGCGAAVGQFIDIPANATGGNMTVWYHRVGPQDTSGFCTDAFFAGLLLASDQQVSVSNGVCEGQTTTDTWNPLDVDVSAFIADHAGETVIVVAQGQTNGNPGPWLVDDVFFEIQTADEPFVYTRDVSLSLRRHLVAKGLINSPNPMCAVDTMVKIQRRRGDGTWATVGTDETNDNGQYSKRVPDKPGRYRAKVVANDLNASERCAGDTSPVRRHSH